MPPPSIFETSEFEAELWETHFRRLSIGPEFLGRIMSTVCKQGAL